MHHLESCVVDSQLKAANKSSSVANFQDPSISTSLPVLDLVDVIKPGIVEYDMVSQGTTDEVSDHTNSASCRKFCVVGYLIVSLPVFTCLHFLY